MTPTPRQLGRELRDGTDGVLVGRRAVVALTLVSMTSLAVVTLYQLGLLRRLPEPPLPGLDAARVNGSAAAYGLLGTPDAVLGLGSYAVTLGLAAVGGPDRSQTHPWIPLALAAKAGCDTLLAAALTRKSWVNYRAFSLYSLITATATVLASAAAAPEARTAWRQVRDHRQGRPRRTGSMGGVWR